MKHVPLEINLVLTVRSTVRQNTLEASTIFACLTCKYVGQLFYKYPFPTSASYSYCIFCFSFL